MVDASVVGTSADIRHVVSLSLQEAHRCLVWGFLFHYATFVCLLCLHYTAFVTGIIKTSPVAFIKTVKKSGLNI